MNLTFVFQKYLFTKSLTFANDSLFATRSGLSLRYTHGWKFLELLNGPVDSVLGRQLAGVEEQRLYSHSDLGEMSE
jgi:hypothetical protein